MKRDMDLIRKILIELDESATYDRRIEIHQRERFKDYACDAIWYHVKLLQEAEYIEAEPSRLDKHTIWEPYCLTWQGHEFLSAARDEARWAKAKEIAGKSGEFVASVMKEILVALIKSQMGVT